MTDSKKSESYRRIIEQGIFYDLNGYKCHIRQHNDEFIVWRFYGRHKQRWHYQVQPIWAFVIGVDYDNYLPERERSQAMKHHDDTFTPPARELYVAVDFDGVLATKAWPGVGDPMPGAVAFLRWLEDEGIGRILWTCREGEKLSDAMAVLFGMGFGSAYWDAVNASAPATVAHFGGDCRKVSAALYVDDNAVGFPFLADPDQAGGLSSVPDFARIQAAIHARRERIRAAIAASALIASAAVAR